MESLILVTNWSVKLRCNFEWLASFLILKSRWSNCCGQNVVLGSESGNRFIPHKLLISALQMSSETFLGSGRSFRLLSITACAIVFCASLEVLLKTPASQEKLELLGKGRVEKTQNSLCDLHDCATVQVKAIRAAVHISSSQIARERPSISPKLLVRTTFNAVVDYQYINVWIFSAAVLEIASRHASWPKWSIQEV